VPTLYCNTVADWGVSALSHMESFAHHRQLMWDRSEGREHVLVCGRCHQAFVLRNSALQDPNPSSRLVADFLRTDWGKTQLLEAIYNRLGRELRPGEHPFDPDTEPSAPENRRTGWSKILDEDPFDD
jgi:hypothetical protein